MTRRRSTRRSYRNADKTGQAILGLGILVGAATYYFGRQKPPSSSSSTSAIPDASGTITGDPVGGKATGMTGGLMPFDASSTPAPSDTAAIPKSTVAVLAIGAVVGGYLIGDAVFTGK